MIDWFIELSNINFVFYFIFLFFLFLLINYFFLTKSIFLKRFIFILRTISITIVLLLLLNPIINVKFLNVSPKILNLFFDNSQSVLIAQNEGKVKLSKIVNDFENFCIDNHIQLKQYFFSDTVVSLESINNMQIGKRTNFSSLFEHMSSNINDNEHSIIISDGLSNQGLINYDKNLSTNIHTLGIGEQLLKYDLQISNISYRKEKKHIILDIVFYANNISYEINKDIYLNNQIVGNYLIGQVSISDNNYKSINIKVPSEHFSYLNTITIGSDLSDYNNNNNNYLLSLNDDLVDDNNIVLITGSLSPNSRIIKQILNDSFSNVNIYHFYKINGEWNQDFNFSDIDNAVAFVFDSFDIDNSNILQIKNKDVKSIYFVNNNTDLRSIEFLNDCFDRNEKLNQIESIYINKYKFDIPPINQKYSFSCINDFEKNSYFYKKNNDLVVNIDNLYNTNHLSTTYNSKNNLFKFIGYLIEDFIYSKSEKLNIFTNNNDYTLNDSIKIFYSYDSAFIKDDNIYLNITDVNNNKINITAKNILENGLAEFIFIPKKEGFYEIAGVYDASDKIDYSNKLNINVSVQDIENDNIYLNQDYLTEISSLNNGFYFNVKDYKELFSILNFEDINKENVIRKDFLSYQYLLILLIFLLIFEWYIRNKIGLP